MPQQQAARTTFFRKAGEESFFGARETPSFFGKPVQPKLTVSSPDDPQEKEADAMADQVMRMSDPASVVAAPADEEKLDRKEEPEEKEAPLQASSEPPLQRSAEEPEPDKEGAIQAKQTDTVQRCDCDKEKDKEAATPVPKGVQRKAGGCDRPLLLQRSGRAPPASQPTSSFEHHLSSSKGGGSALSPSTRQTMENRFGADFSQVRIHTGSGAESLSRQINAQAFTHGSDIYFNAGKYAPDTAPGGHLLAHELTHTLQQGAATVQRKVNKSATSIPPPVQSTALGTGVFAPADSIASYIAEGGSKARDINVHFGNYAKGTLKVRKTRKGFYETPGDGYQALDLQLPPLQPLANAGLQPVLAVRLQKDSKIEGYITLGTGPSATGVGSKNSLFDSIKKNPLLMNWAGMQKLSVKEKITNEIQGDAVVLSVNDIHVTLGGFVQATFSMGLHNAALTVKGNAAVKIKNLTEGSMDFERDAAGNLKGKFEVQTNIKNFSGSVKGAFLNGIFDIHGKAAYSTEKLRGEVNIVVTDARSAKAAVLQQLEPQQISQAAEERAGIGSEATEGPQPGPRVIAGWGTLDFAFNDWLTGSAKVIVDDEGYVTVHGEITPPAQVRLFDAKPYRSPNFLDIHPTFRWGVPHVADVHIGLDFLLYAEAQIGPAILKDIKVIGNYSTDPLLFNDFRIQATFNLMGYAGLVFTFGAHAGLGILGFDIDLGGKLKATAGIKGYVEATPVIGYREKEDPVAGKKGEFFIKGTAEVAAQPVLGLEGLITLSVDSPWPIPNFGHEWSMFKKEYPLPGQFGIGLTFGEYILGSGQWPDVDFNRVSFDPDKFADDLLEDNVPDKQAHPEEKKGGFTDKQQGQQVAPPPPPVPVPAPAPAGKGGARDKAKKPKPPTKETLERWTSGMKAMKALQEKRNKEPVPEKQLLAELRSIRSKFRFNTITATPSGHNYAVYAEMQGINNATTPIGIKGLVEEKKEDKKQDQKAGEEAVPESKKVTDLKAKVHLAKPFTMNGEDHTLYLNFKNGKPVIEMASGRRAMLRQLVVNALQEIKDRRGSPWDEMRTRMNALLQKELDPLTEKLVDENHSEEFKNVNDYEVALGHVTTLLTIIGNEFHVKSLAFVLPATTAPVYGPLENGFAKSMEIAVLTRDGVKGTAVDDSLRAVGHMRQLDKRLEGGSKYYVLGHLLSSNLHGPGNIFSNLTPITISANGLHETQIESEIKQGISNDRIFYYKVEAKYGRTFNSALYNQFVQLNQPVKAAIVRAEQYVPQCLLCTVRELQPDGKDLPGGFNRNAHPISVDIDQSLSGYEI